MILKQGQSTERSRRKQHVRFTRYGGTRVRFSSLSYLLLELFLALLGQDRHGSQSLRTQRLGNKGLGSPKESISSILGSEHGENDGCFVYKTQRQSAHKKTEERRILCGGDARVSCASSHYSLSRLFSLLIADMLGGFSSTHIHVPNEIK